MALKIEIFIVLQLGKLKVGYWFNRFWWECSYCFAVGHLLCTTWRDRKRGSKFARAFSYEVTNSIIKVPPSWLNYLSKVISHKYDIEDYVSTYKFWGDTSIQSIGTLAIILSCISQALITATMLQYLSRLQCAQTFLSFQKRISRVLVHDIDWLM